MNIEKNRFYRIKNNFTGSEDCFWYQISSDKKDLHSCCVNEREAQVYSSKEIEEHKDLISCFSNAKLILV